MAVRIHITDPMTGLTAGWYDRDKADRYEPRERETEPGRGTELHRTAKGVWVQYWWTVWEGEAGSAAPVSEADATQWLLDQGYSNGQVAEITGETIEEERVPPGRPPIGRIVNVRMDEGMITQIEAAAQDAGVSRAEWVRRAVTAALNSSNG